MSWGDNASGERGDYSFIPDQWPLAYNAAAQLENAQ
jgi:hypothetical protein